MEQTFGSVGIRPTIKITAFNLRLILRFGGLFQNA